jgi:hypothetical protein
LVFQIITFSQVPVQNSLCTSPVFLMCHMPFLSQSSWFYHPNNISWGFRSYSSSLCTLFSPVGCYFGLLKPKVLFNTLFSNILRLRSSLNVRDQVSHPYTSTFEIIVLFISIFIFLDNRTGRQKILHPMKTSVHWLLYVLFFFIKRLLIC